MTELQWIVTDGPDRVAQPIEREDLDLGRLTSSALVEVRGILSRVETALAYSTFDKNTLIVKEGDFRMIPGATEAPFSGHYGRITVEPHPELAEMKAALEQVVELLGPWRRTGRPTKATTRGKASE